MPRQKSIIATFLIVIFALFCCACNSDGRSTTARQLESGDPDYEALTIEITGLRELDGGIAQISVSELRSLPQQELEASYIRTTGLKEEFYMTGPLIRDVIQFAGGNLYDYDGIGVVGRDQYYCLLSSDVIESTPDLLLAVTVDG
ncbi:MAG: hypothetical protein FWD21_00825, partial [Peptococcaceae bacterium]|nr:hypothetical protein [Peptococcaceae bacterium]